MTRPPVSISTLDLGIDRRDSEPLQAQIARQIRDMVLHGRLKPDVRLPSSRTLADELGVARATVVEAFEQLAGEGYIETKAGSGTRVASELPETLLSSGLFGERLHAPVRPAPVRQLTKRIAARPFRSGLVDWEHFPHDDWGKLLGRYWRNPPVTLLEHNDVFGWGPLRTAIAAHLFEWRGIQCTPAQVIMTAGGMDAFDLVFRAALKPNDQLWLEEPGYATARRVFEMGGIEIANVPVDGEGLVVSAAQIIAPHARAAFVTPARQYPTGVTMPLSRRLELLTWAREAGAIVIEDDYDSEYRYVGKPLPSLMSLATSIAGGVQVIYSGSFSKVFSPIMRLGYLVVPDALLDKFHEARSNHGAPPSLMIQPALATFMESGAFAMHIRRMRRIYAARREALIDALQEGHGSLFQLDAPPAGLMVLLRFAPHLEDDQIAVRLREQGVETLTLSSHYVGAARENGLLLSFAGFSERELRQSARIVLAVLKASIS
jgi:GntR family transcriptional regulator / MocR family aminotransferase